MEASVLWVLSIVASLWVGSYFSPYLRRRAENLATHEDLDKLVEQMKATTEATKAIDARISDAVWDRQRRWELRRDTVVNVIQSMMAARQALTAYGAALQIPCDRRQFLETWNTSSNQFDSLRVTAQLICGNEVNEALWEARQVMRGAFSDLADRKISNYDEIGPTIRDATEHAIAMARHELGAAPPVPRSDFGNPSEGLAPEQ